MSLRATFGAGRRAAIFANVVAMVSLAAIAAAIAIYLAGFTPLKRRIDLTRSATYTLTPATLSLLSNLDRDVEIVTVTDTAATDPWDENLVRARGMEYVRDLLQEYKVRSAGRIAVENLDVRQDRAQVTDLLRELGVSLYNFVVVRCGDNRKLLSFDPDLAEIDRGMPNVRPTALVAYRVEEGISSALYGIVDDVKPKVYVITGHDEVSVSQTGQEGGSLLAASLSRDNVKVEEWPLFQSRRIPDDAAAVFLLGPRPGAPLVEEERAALDGYLRKGGHLLVCLDPFCDLSLDALWTALGVDIERNIIITPQAPVMKNVGPTAHFVGPNSGGSYGSHPIMDGLGSRSSFMVLEGSGAVTARAGAEKDFTTLLSSYPMAFGDVPLGPDKSGDFKLDKRVEGVGQRCLGAAIAPTDGDYKGARVVFVPSLMWILNRSLSSYSANDEFLRRATSWLIGKQKGTISPPPRLPPPNATDLKGEEWDEIAKYTGLLMPAAAALLALVVWFARRN